MQINREIIKKELDKLIETIFALPEVTSVKVRDVIMERGEDRSAKLQDAMEKSYHDCCSDVDLAVLVTLMEVLRGKTKIARMIKRGGRTYPGIYPNSGWISV